ncbi:MAG TPA: hypothetical protein VLT62_11990 [Candidatus Methylomirabilis sp.]|nr:hypothetical protein [Candidatus Methylomirabilis sp.]
MVVEDPLENQVITTVGEWAVAETTITAKGRPVQLEGLEKG